MKLQTKIFILSCIAVFTILVLLYNFVHSFTLQSLQSYAIDSQVSVNKIAIEAKASENARRISIVISPFLILFCLLVLLIVSGFLNSIQAIIRTSNKIALGSLNKRIQISSHDESRELAAAVNAVTDKLCDLYVRLEKLVKDRTDVLIMRVSELEYEKAKIEAMLESIGDGMFVVGASSRIILMNIEAKKIFNLENERVIGQVFTELIPEQNENGKLLPGKESSLMRALNGEKISTSIDKKNITYFVRKNKSIFPARLTCSPIRLHGKIIGATATLRDVTRELETDKMKTEFISLASHQLRTPLSAIKWFTEMLLAGDAGKLNPEQEEFTKNIAGSTERMIELVRGLLNISRMESGRIIIDPQPTEIEEMLTNLIAELKLHFPDKSYTISINKNGQLPKVNVDPKLIRQVYMNLLTNSIKYSRQNDEIKVMLSIKDKEVISQISDNGFGIPVKQQNRIFQKFFRADNVVKIETDGSGLGLYLVKQIIEASGGRIWFESEENKGTTFWFSLPVEGISQKKGEIVLD